MDEPTPVPEGYYPPEGPQESSEHKPSTSLPVIAGILLIIAALSGFITWSNILAWDASQFQNFLPNNSQIPVQTYQSILQTCSIIGVVFSALALIGGLMAIRKRSWGLSITGSILGLFTIGVFFTASVFSLIALVFLIMTRREFTPKT